MSQDSIFGRHESPRSDSYLGAINRYYQGLVKLDHSLHGDLSDLNRADQESEDFESDIKSAIEDVEKARTDLGKKIMAHRRVMGL